ncbi:hypothetical protein OIDMADRAFT_18603 [Oidiodendron maius Zn]|uniref:Uncharacterized protein n=1 Tax=Oidiodendron maius (strain Zn) TaxID=913774 RepID=A0A0C3CRP5_OIDMZ|nr:hypothetical protein OIDMADRAFT_18603 [Oidiodendron maius Zn]
MCRPPRPTPSLPRHLNAKPPLERIRNIPSRKQSLRTRQQQRIITMFMHCAPEPSPCPTPSLQ